MVFMLRRRRCRRLVLISILFGVGIILFQLWTFHFYAKNVRGSSRNPAIIELRRSRNSDTYIPKVSRLSVFTHNPGSQPTHFTKPSPKKNVSWIQHPWTSSVSRLSVFTHNPGSQPTHSTKPSPKKNVSWIQHPWTSSFRGYLNVHVWLNWCGSTVNDLRRNIHFPTFPDVRIQTSLFHLVHDSHNYGQRVFGFLHPPKTGYYVFAISSDDSSELWLSTDDNPTHSRLIAWVGNLTDIGWEDATGDGQFTKFHSQISKKIFLRRGGRYFVEALHKQSTMNDHLLVAWKMPRLENFSHITRGRISRYIHPHELANLDVSRYSRHIPVSPATLQPAIIPQKLREEYGASPGDPGVRNTKLFSELITASLHPKCSYSPSYLVNFNLTRYEGVYLVHETAVYPDDNTYIRHVAKYRPCMEGREVDSHGKRLADAEKEEEVPKEEDDEKEDIETPAVLASIASEKADREINAPNVSSHAKSDSRKFKGNRSVSQKDGESVAGRIEFTKRKLLAVRLRVVQNNQKRLLRYKKGEDLSHNVGRGNPSSRLLDVNARVLLAANDQTSKYMDNKTVDVGQRLRSSVSQEENADRRLGLQPTKIISLKVMMESKGHSNVSGKPNDKRSIKPASLVSLNAADKANRIYRARQTGGHVEMNYRRMGDLQGTARIEDVQGSHRDMLDSRRMQRSASRSSSENGAGYMEERINGNLKSQHKQPETRSSVGLKRKTKASGTQDESLRQRDSREALGDSRFKKADGKLRSRYELRETGDEAGERGLGTSIGSMKTRYQQRDSSDELDGERLRGTNDNMTSRYKLRGSEDKLGDERYRRGKGSMKNLHGQRGARKSGGDIYANARRVWRRSKKVSLMDDSRIKGVSTTSLTIRQLKKSGQWSLIEKYAMENDLLFTRKTWMYVTWKYLRHHKPKPAHEKIVGYVYKQNTAMCRTDGNILLNERVAKGVVLKYLKDLRKEHKRDFQLKRIVNIEENHDVFKGDRYLIELDLQEKGKSEVFHVSDYVYLPLGEEAFCSPQDFSWQENATVHVIVPVKDQGKWVQHFIDDMSELYQETLDPHFNVIIVDFNSSDINIEEALARSALKRYKLLKVNGSFQRALGIQVGADAVQNPNDILFTCDLHLEIPNNMIQIIRKHCVKGKMAFSPMVMRLECGYTPSLPYGEWETMGFGLFAIYKSDFDRIGGMNHKEFKTKWGGEDWEMVDRVLQSQMEIERLRVPRFYHFYHSKHGMWGTYSHEDIVLDNGHNMVTEDEFVPLYDPEKDSVSRYSYNQPLLPEI